MIGSGDQELTADAARYLLSNKLTAADEERVNALSAKARSGSLTGSEAQELDNYLHVGLLLGVPQSKARQLIQKHSDSARH